MAAFFTFCYKNLLTLRDKRNQSYYIDTFDFCSQRQSKKTFHDASSTLHVTMNMEGCAFQIRFRDRRNRVIHILIFVQQKCPVTRLMQPAL